jgi:hypothetical protein
MIDPNLSATFVADYVVQFILGFWFHLDELVRFYYFEKSPKQ